MPSTSRRPIGYRSTSRVRAVEVGDQRVDRGVGLLQDRRDPPVEAPAAERGLHRRPPPLPVGAVGHDHRRRAGDEPDHVERVAPAERRRRHGQQLVDDRRVAEHDHPQRPGAEREHRPQLGRQLVEHRLGLDEASGGAGAGWRRSGRAGQRAIRRLRRVDPMVVVAMRRPPDPGRRVDFVLLGAPPSRRGPGPWPTACPTGRRHPSRRLARGVSRPAVGRSPRFGAGARCPGVEQVSRRSRSISSRTMSAWPA